MNEYDPCLCCGHTRTDHDAGGDGLARRCSAELFTVAEEVVTDCPCGDFILWPAGAEHPIWGPQR